VRKTGKSKMSPPPTKGLKECGPAWTETLVSLRGGD
jgi:hypothetical protein